MKELFELLVTIVGKGEAIEVPNVISQLGLRGKIYDVTAIQVSPHISDETKSALMISSAIKTAQKCEICNARLEINKSRSYDHIQEKANSGTGDILNVRLVHPYCNNSRQSLDAM